MPKTFRGTFMVGLTGYYTNDVAGVLAESYQRIPYAVRKAFTSGSGDNQCDLVYLDPEKELASTSQSYELDALASDGWGDTITLSKIRFIIIESLTLTSGFDLTIGGDFVSDSGALPLVVTPGGIAVGLWPVDGITVTNGSRDTLTIDSVDKTIKYDLIIGGND